MIIALCGRSSSGKTTIADALRHHLGDYPTRHCGELVKARAQDLRRSRNGLPDEEHREIDSETRRWSETQIGLALVEGRYLHYVLSLTCADVRLIELVCDEAAREHRWSKRMGRALGSGELSAIDAADRDFAVKMYSGLTPLPAGLRVDTTLVDVNECVHQILTWLNQFNQC